MTENASIALKSARDHLEKAVEAIPEKDAESRTVVQAVGSCVIDIIAAVLHQSEANAQDRTRTAQAE